MLRTPLKPDQRVCPVCKITVSTRAKGLGFMAPHSPIPKTGDEVPTYVSGSFDDLTECPGSYITAVVEARRKAVAA